MKINLDFYKEKQEELEPIEEEIIEKIKQTNPDRYYEEMKKDTRTEVICALSETRKNILSWYPFKENANILEIGANFGELTGLLCEKATKVVAIESSLKKAKAIEKRYKKKNNVEIIVGNIANIKLQEKFDYITLIGTLENINKIFSGTVQEFLQLLKMYLKNDGKFIIAVDNRLGMKYFSKTDKTGINVTNEVGKKLYTLEEVTKILEGTGLAKQKIYYPMPDYKLTNVIYTDSKPLSKNNLSRNIIYNSEDTIRFYEENQAYREILKEDSSTFKLFANSYLIEIGNENLDGEGIRFVSFSNMRKPEYKIKTIMERENVYKYPVNNQSKQHIENIKQNIDIMTNSNIKTVDSYDDNRIISRYTEAFTLDKIIMNYIKQDKNQEAILLIERFKNELDEKLEKSDSTNNVFDKYEIQYDVKNIENMKFVKYGLWDLIFQNCFYISDEFYFYDQEWREEKVPINFILYRAIKYFTRIKKYISDEKLYEMMNIEKEQIKLFDELDDKIQGKLRNELMWKLHTQGIDVIDLKRNELTANHQINLLTIQDAQNKVLIEQKDKEIEELKKKLNYVYNSKSWRITRPLRKILKLGRKNK